MKILILTASGEPLNSIRPEAEMYIGLQQRGHQVTIMTGRGNVYWERFALAGLGLILFEPARRVDPAAVRFLRRTLKSGGYDVIYALNNNAICTAAFAALGLPAALVTYRGQTGNISKWDPSVYLTHLHPRVDGISCVAEAVRQDLLAQGRDPSRVVTIYKGHDLAWYHDPPLSREVLGVPEEAFLIGCVANNRPRKGLPVLVEAFHGLPEGGRTPHLLLAGKGLDAPELQQAIQAGPGAARIHCLGFREDAPSLTAACDCTVLPALKREGLPKTVIESMAYSVPPVVTDTGGNAELVEEGVSGFVVPPGSVDALRERLAWLQAHPREAEDMGRNARQRLAEHFDLQQSILQTEAFFQASAAERTSGR